ncbi:tRNA lysidine(34) synthetase TilS [bacterium]|nr:tRNA lysidine(34) synthetase TilS [bacterium]
MQRFADWFRCDGGKLIVSCSGGIDSIVLAHAAIAQIRNLTVSGFWKQGAPEVILWHLRHGIRPDDEKDALFVSEQAGRWGVGAIVESGDVLTERVPGTDSIESVARRIRYDRLERFMHSTGKCIAFTAHHADDNAETILFNLVRGTGPAGLRGISPGIRNVIYRPLLDVRSIDIHEYAAAQKLSWHEDPSNADRRFSRNLIRHEIMPLLERLNPAYVQHINRLADYASDLLETTPSGNDFHVRSSEEICNALPLLHEPRARFGALEFGTTDLSKLTTITLGKALSRIGLHPRYDLISEFHWSLSRSNDSVHHGNWHFHFPFPGKGLVFYEDLQLDGMEDTAFIAADLTSLDLSEAARRELVDLAASRNLHIGLPGDPQKQDWWHWLSSLWHDDDYYPGEWQAILPSLQSGLYSFRTRLPGDRITLSNGATRKVGDVFTDLKVPEFLRDCWALLVNAENEVVWIPALADSQRMHGSSQCGEYVLASIRPLE